jgi:hypothetical protein
MPTLLVTGTSKVQRTALTVYEQQMKEKHYQDDLRIRQEQRQQQQQGFSIITRAICQFIDILQWISQLIARQALQFIRQTFYVVYCVSTNIGRRRHHHHEQ